MDGAPVGPLGDAATLQERIKPVEDRHTLRGAVRSARDVLPA